MIPIPTLLHLLRNPHGHSDDELRAARLQAAEMIEAEPQRRTDEYRRGFINGQIYMSDSQPEPPTRPIAGSFHYRPWVSTEELAERARNLLRESGVPMRDPDNHRSGQASGTLTWSFDVNNFKASFVWVP